MLNSIFSLTDLRQFKRQDQSFRLIKTSSFQKYKEQLYYSAITGYLFCFLIKRIF